jgi:hypothetical protein
MPLLWSASSAGAATRWRRRKKDFRGAESEYAKAGAAADELNRKEPPGQSEAIEADRAIGNGWGNLSIRVQNADAKKRFAELSLHFFQLSIELNQRRIDVLRSLAEGQNHSSQDVFNLAQAYGNQSWWKILVGDFSGGLKDSEAALKWDPKQEWILGNQGHALLFLHRVDEAKQVYLKYANGGKDDAGYQKSVFEDFAELRKHRPPNADLKLIDEMEDFLVNKGGYSKPSEKASN